MNRIITYLISGLILAFATVGNSEPIAVIKGPNKTEIGQCVFLKTTGSQGKSFQWKVIPEEAIEGDFTPMPIYGGMDPGPDGKLGTPDDFPIVHQWAHFSSSKPGTYYFIYVATENDQSAIAIHKIVNGDEAPTPVPDKIIIPEPIDPYKGYVTSITPLISGSDAEKDGRNLAMFYMDLANVVARDETIIKTTADIKKLNENAGQLMFQKTGIKGKYPNLGATIDKVFVAILTLENVPLTKVKRDEVVKGITAIAWACLQASERK